jgi:hypothetical protein
MQPNAKPSFNDKNNRHRLLLTWIIVAANMYADVAADVDAYMENDVAAYVDNADVAPYVDNDDVAAYVVNDDAAYVYDDVAA